MKKLLLLLLMVSLLIVSVSASDDAFVRPVQRGYCTQLTQTCANCTSVNITTIQHLNQTLQVLNQPMTPVAAGVYNYSFCETQSNGEVIYNTIGNPNGVLDTQTVHLPITPNGEEPTIAKAIFYVGLLGVLLLFLGLIFWAHMGDKSELTRFWWFSFMWIPMIGITFICWNMASDFLTSSPMIASIFKWAFLVMIICYPFFLLTLVLYTFYWIYNQKAVQELITRGFTQEEAENRVRGGRGGDRL